VSFTLPPLIRRPPLVSLTRPRHASPFCPAKSSEGREPVGERMGAEHQFLSTVEGELGGEAGRRRGRGRGRTGDPRTRVLCREPRLRTAWESAAGRSPTPPDGRCLPPRRGPPVAVAAAPETGDAGEAVASHVAGYSVLATASCALGCSAPTARAAQCWPKLEEGQVGDVEQEIGKMCEAVIRRCCSGGSGFGRRELRADPSPGVGSTRACLRGSEIAPRVGVGEATLHLGQRDLPPEERDRERQRGWRAAALRVAGFRAARRCPPCALGPKLAEGASCARPSGCPEERDAEVARQQRSSFSCARPPRSWPECSPEMTTDGWNSDKME
jgi:hypothetical protein